MAVPTSWLSVVLFLVLVAPGIWYDILSERRRTSPSESTFREVGRVVLASVGFSGLAICVLAVIRILFPAVMPDPRYLFSSNSTYSRDHYRLLLRTIVFELAIAICFAYLLHAFFAKRQGGSKIRPVSQWSIVFRAERPKDHDVYVRVRLTNGTVYSGLLAYFTPEVEVADRELTLAQPTALFKSGSSTDLPLQYQRTIIRGSSVEVLNVEYRENTTETPNRRRKFHLRHRGRALASSPSVHGSSNRLANSGEVEEAEGTDLPAGEHN